MPGVSPRKRKRLTPRAFGVSYSDATRSTGSSHLFRHQRNRSVSAALPADGQCESLQRTLLDYRGQGRFLLHAFVVMPDHFHAIITPAPDVSLEKAMQYIKGGFSFRLKSKRDVWMRSFNETQILNQEKYLAAVWYIEQNPVRRGLAQIAADYPHSSAGFGTLDPAPAHMRATVRA